jgi:hypothetical protein
VVQLRIALRDVEPEVWRRALVPGDVPLSDLHDIIQVLMGWTDSHLHSFEIGDARYGPQYDDHPDDELDEKSVTVAGALKGHDRFAYEYDFGDSWDHDVVVERTITAAPGLVFGVCLDGRQACPPEDCGGSGGYADLLGILADTTHEEHASVLEWLGGGFDPAAFDVAQANVDLQGYS